MYPCRLQVRMELNPFNIELGNMDGTFHTSNAIIVLKTKPQNRKGNTMRGKRLSKNDLIDQSLPRDKAPDSIKNNGTPNLQHECRNKFKPHEKE